MIRLLLSVPILFGCGMDGQMAPDSEMPSMKDQDVGPDGAVPIDMGPDVEVGPDVGIGDCRESRIVYQEDAPSPQNYGCDCFKKAIPPTALGCQNPSIDECVNSGGEFTTSDVPGDRCRHHCDLDGNGLADWEVTHDRFRVRWWIGEDGNLPARTEGICEYGWSVWTIEGEGREVYDASVTGGGRGCICWADDPARCPVGCAPPTRPLCDVAEGACGQSAIGDECGVRSDGQDVCRAGDQCISGTCERNTSLAGRMACCI